MLAIPRGSAGFGLRVHKRTLIEKLDEIFGEKNVQRPIDGYAHFLFGAWQFAPVNSAPEKPREEPGKVYAENARDTCAATDRSKRAERSKAERRFRSAVNGRDNVARDNFAFARCMLRRRRTIFACRWIWNERAITERPKTIHTFYFQVRIDSDSPAFQTSVELTIFSPSLSSISFGRTAATLLFARISTPRSRSFLSAYRPSFSPSSGKMYSPGCTSTSRSISSLRFG